MRHRGATNHSSLSPKLSIALAVAPTLADSLVRRRTMRGPDTPASLSAARDPRTVVRGPTGPGCPASLLRLALAQIADALGQARLLASRGVLVEHRVLGGPVDQALDDLLVLGSRFEVAAFGSDDEIGRASCRERV